MTTDRSTWEPFGVPAAEYEPAVAGKGPRVLNLTLRGGKDAAAKDRGGAWLRNAMIALGLLAAAAAVVSFEAQYRMVYAAKGVRLVAVLEAGIPDVSAVVFAALGIALALQGKRALRPRALNVAAVATSIGMNYLAAASGWRAAAIWVMPSVAYAVASDTAIGVIRAYAIARQRQLREDLADDEVTPLAILGGLFLWWLRLALAPRSTLTGFRGWVVDSCPVAPGQTVAGRRADEAGRLVKELAGQAAQAQAAIETARADHGAELERVRCEIEQTRAAAQAEAAAALAERDRAADVAAQRAQDAVRAQQAAESARAELERTREDASQQVAQMRADAGRERDDLRAALEARSTALEAARNEARARADQAAGEAERARGERDQAARAAAEAQGRLSQLAARAATATPDSKLTPARREKRNGRGESKRARLIEAYQGLGRGGDPRYGDRAQVSPVAKELAPAAGLEWGSARTYLYRHLDGRASA
jgi:hypothetical protein